MNESAGDSECDNEKGRIMSQINLRSITACFITIHQVNRRNGQHLAQGGSINPGWDVSVSQGTKHTGTNSGEINSHQFIYSHIFGGGRKPKITERTQKEPEGVIISALLPHHLLFDSSYVYFLQ